MSAKFSHPVRFADLAKRKTTRLSLTPDPDPLAQMARDLGVSALKKVTALAELTPEGKSDWRLTVTGGATFVQPCVVSLVPVTTRVDLDDTRRYLAAMPPLPDAAEIEMPDDGTEPLPAALDLGDILQEILALSAPEFPRAEGVALGEAVFAAEGVTPLRDEDARPFAGLAGLKAQLDGKKGGNPAE